MRFFAPTALEIPGLTDQKQEAADELIALLDVEKNETGPGAARSAADKQRVFELASQLAACSSAAKEQGSLGTEEAPLAGTWRLLFQGKEDVEVSATDLESWRKYFAGEGPSPVQNLVTTDSSSVGNVYQVLELNQEGQAKLVNGAFVNLIDFSPAGCLEISAKLEEELAPGRLSFRFEGGEFRLRPLWNGTLTLPYPVPFKLLGDNAVGWLETLYLDGRLRVSRGNKGSLFVLVRDDGAGEAEDSLLRAAEDLGPPSAPGNEGLTRDPIVLCPAQFGTPGDYEEFAAELRSRGHPVFVAPLTKLNWFELVPSFFSEAYWKGELEPGKVLQFYYRAIDAAYQDAQAHIAKTGGTGRVHLVAHSIGGWVARAWMGEVLAPRGEIGSVASLVTLGTPHGEPPKGSWVEAADQTRGLLKNINARFPGAFHEDDGVRYISVSSASVPGSFPNPFGSEGGNWLESGLGWASYLALCGDGDVRGDGITPVESALLPGTEHIRLGEPGDANGTKTGCFHAGFLPSPGPSIALQGAPWYGNGEALEAWLPLIQK